MKIARTKLGRKVASVLALAALAGPAAFAQDAAPLGNGSRIVRIASDANGAPQLLSLGLNKAVVVELDRDARDVLIANPAIADAVVRTPRRIFIMSLKVGQTNAIFLDGNGRQIGTIEITVGSDVDDLRAQISAQIPGGQVRVQSLNDNVVLSGTVNNVQEASRAQDMAASFTGDPKKVVNNIGIGQRQQVLIQVRVSEMSRTISKQLGLNTITSVESGGVPIVVSTDNQFNLLGRALSNLSGAQIGQTCVPMPGCTAPNNVQANLKALERVGLVRTLAEPNLTAISGESAKFLAGGEFPVPASRDRDGNISVIFKQFGVGLAFTPVVLSQGRISLQISTEVSELTSTGSLSLGGLTLPGLAVRRTETTVELSSGGSLAIGGLIQQQTKQSLDAFPGAKDVPVLGALFRSRDFQNNESELVVTVTAYLVNPVSPTQLARPDDNFALPTDLEQVLMGRLNAVYGKRELEQAAPKNAAGYIVQ